MVRILSVAAVALGLILIAVGLVQAAPLESTPADHAGICEVTGTGAPPQGERPRLLPCWKLAESDALSTRCPSERALLGEAPGWPPSQRPAPIPAETEPEPFALQAKIEPPPPKAIQAPTVFPM